MIYIVNGQFLGGGMDVLQRDSVAALIPMQETRSCLYVIPIGNIFSAPGSAGLIDRDAVQDLVNAAGCGQRYEAQKTPTIASTLLEAVLLSQGRTLLTQYGEQLPLFSRATAKMNRLIPIKDDLQTLRIDVIWGAGTLDVALQPPSDAEIAPTINSGTGYQSLTIHDPAAGPWNIKLSVTQVPENQVAVVLFSQGNQSVAPPANTALSTSIPSEVMASPERETAVPDISNTAESVIEASPIIPTAAMMPTISDTLAAPRMTISPVPDAIAPVSEPANSPLPLMAAVIMIMGALTGVFLLWRNRRSPAPDGPAGSTLHSRATAELPPVPFPPNLNTSTPVSDKRRAVQTHSPVPTDVGFGETQFRQFPAQIVFKNGAQSGQVFEVDSGYFMIGRHSTSNLRVQDGTVSREHARIIFDNAQNLYLIENVSQAGTQVNGQYIAQRRPLYSGDLIQVGNIQIHFQLRVHTSI